MNNQDIFNISGNHLITQNKKAIKEGTKCECMYRGGDGTMWAVGALIKDKYYHRSLEQNGIVRESVREALRKSLNDADLDKRKLALINDLQLCHDLLEVKEWNDGLNYIASKYKLELPKKVKKSGKLSKETSEHLDDVFCF